MISILTVSGFLALLPMFFFISITPGMCMTLSLTLSINIGFKKTLSMMSGEIIGVALIIIFSVLGVGSIMLKYPNVFFAFKLVGGAYLFYLGVQLWISKGKVSLNLEKVNTQVIATNKLAMQGFITAIFNPKGWAFFIALLPPFINYKESIPMQLSVILIAALSIEFCCLCIYALGGEMLKKGLQNSTNVRIVNRISGSLMCGVGIWLALS